MHSPGERVSKLTNEALESIASDALSVLDDWKLISAAIREFHANGATAKQPAVPESVVWLNLLDSTQTAYELIFSLQHDDPEWVKQEIIRRLNSGSSNIRNKINVGGSVSGLLVGTNTGVINKNFFGGDTYHQVQFYALSDSGRSAGMATLIKEISAPYKFLLPYTPRDLPIFRARANEIEQVLRFIHEQRLVVIHGDAGVGKTSLLAAGVIPKLIDEGLLVIQIQDFTSPVETVYQALKSVKDQITIPLPDDPTLPQLIESIVKATDGTLILVLDQFELIFEASISVDQREAFTSQLAQSLDEIDAAHLRVFIVIRNEANARLWELLQRLPNLLNCQFELLPLDHQQAAEAIWEPLKVMKSQVTFFDEFEKRDSIPDLVTKHLVPNLAALRSDGIDKFVHPPHLQIVCSWLYRKASETDPPRVIGERMYLDELKGADGIIASYMEETLEKLGDERRIATGIMALMTTPEVETWVLPSQLHEMNRDLPVITIERVLETLVLAGLLVRRAGDRKYAFMSPTIARDVLRLAGPEAEKRNRAENELQRIWLTWLARSTWATREQLRYLATEGGHLPARAIKTLVLLRSSVERDEPSKTWIDLLDHEDGKSLIWQLEGLPSPSDSNAIDLNTLKKAANVLGLSNEPAVSAANQDLTSFGALARNAVLHADSAVRQTCALALSVISGDKTLALGRLDQALQSQTKGWTSKKRRAELRGALADTDSEFEKQNMSLGRLDRMLIWKWRAARRVARDRRRWITLMIGGAIGAGLSLAIVRAIIAATAFTPAQPAIQFGAYFYFAFLLGGSVGLGMALAKPLMLRGSDASSTLSGRSLTGPLPILLGAIFFGLTHFFVALINGLSPMSSPLMLPMGFVAGLGLCVAVSLRGRLRFGWLIALVLAACIFALTQLVFQMFGNRGDALSIVWIGWFYEATFGGYSWWPQLIRQHPNLPEWLAVIDAALVGTCLTAGIGLGLILATKSLNKRRPSIDFEG